MENETVLTTEFKIFVDGQKITNAIKTMVAEVTVDQNVHMPHMFTMRLYDPKLDILDEGPFDLTKKVKITASDSKNQPTVLIEGEITALEPVFGVGMVAELVVRGYDRTHRLYRETKSRAFLNKKDSDLAQELGQEAGLDVLVDPTDMVYDHIYQHNQTNLAFLMQRAWRIGYDCYLDDGALYFCKPKNSGGGLTLTWGDDLVNFRPRMTLAEQVDEVMVRGWDIDKQQAIVGMATDGELYPQIKESQSGAAWAGEFGPGKLVLVNHPVVTQAEADALAKARLDERSGAFILAEGEALRRPDLKAGQVVELKLLGRRLSGKYLVTAVTHSYTPEGFRSRFTVRGARTGLLLEQFQNRDLVKRWYGAVTAVVTNTDDPKNWGRVKVKFPWLTEDAESDWARMVAPGAGPKAGFFMLPEVNDEVLVAFEHGDFSRPYVIGTMWNGKHAPPPPVDEASKHERPLVRTWYSRTGHAITMYDDSKSKVEIKSSKGLSIVIDDNSNKITISGSAEVEISSDANMKLEAGGDLEMKASGSMNLDAAKLEINGHTNVNISGKAQVAVSGGLIKLN
jgi:phage protein D